MNQSEASKPVVWLRGEVKTPPFSSEARVEAGVLLLGRLQRGEKLSMPHSRPMPGIGPGCHELRVPDRAASWRISYFIDADAIVILEVLEKTSNKTPSGVVNNCRRRMRAYSGVR